MFWLFDLIFPLMYLLTFGIFVVVIVRVIRNWLRNNNAPRLTVPAKVVSRRYSTSRRCTSNGCNHISTRHYVTFEVESGDRMEFFLEGWQFGLLVEGDQGNLTFQGTRFVDFQRT